MPTIFPSDLMVKLTFRRGPTAFCQPVHLNMTWKYFSNYEPN